MFARFDENPAMSLQDFLAYINMFARFDENPAMTLQDIKKTKALVWPIIA